MGPALRPDLPVSQILKSPTLLDENQKHPDDADRVCASGRNPHTGMLNSRIDARPKLGWTVTSKKKDWQTIHPVDVNETGPLHADKPSSTPMKTSITLCLALACALQVRAEEPTPEIAGLQKAAADFVTAYNNKDAAAIAALFTEDGEMADLTGGELTSGREEIIARYEEVFADDPPQMAIEVDSVRLVAPNLAIEDGTFHLTPADDEDAPPRSTTYTAVLMKNAEGVWQIASTRNLNDVTEATGQLADLAEVLKGEWTARTSDGIQLDLAFGWDPTGKFLAGDTLTTTADAEPQDGTIRIGWTAARKSIVSWIFDAKGGVTQGVWTPTDEGWLIRAEGTTADGETITASQKLSTGDNDTLIWSATNRVVDGEKQPDTELRIVRQAPEPAAE
jgi:uncharacterized protein (TIGR02246 family)